jgi:pyruvate dehydrogenase E2 component (dihydrolipoamide acetyltransferase)
MADLRMPSLGADMEYGTLVQWRVKAGDVVHRGDVVAEVETQKGVFEIDVREDGVIEALLVQERARIPVGTPMARLSAAGEAPAAVPGEVIAGLPAPAAPPISPAAPHEAAPAVPPRTDGRRPRASPLARKIAARLGVDLAAVAGTGEGGMITRADVERSAVTHPTAPARITEKGEAPTPMRQAVAAAVSRSKREIPHYYLSHDIDLGPAITWLRATNERRSVSERLLPAALLLRAVALALVRHPALNGFYVDGEFHPSADVHPGVAISVRGGGLVAPAIHHADRLSVDALMQALSDLVRRARSGGLKTSEISDPTITVTNLGEEGVQAVFPIITPPQVAIVGFGAIAERPWAREGLLGVRPVVTASLAADHRVTDGREGALYLAEVARLLARPEAL